MKVAFIEPMAHMGDYQTGFYMVLPEMLGGLDYHMYYKYVQGYKILDNGAAEGVDPSDEYNWSKLLEQAQAIGVDEVVVPDAMGSASETQRRAFRFGNWLEKQEGDWSTKVKWMGVAHGRTTVEFLSCIQTLATIDYITVLGLPRIVANKVDRFARVRTVRNEALSGIIQGGFPDGVHCLGGSVWPGEVSVLAEDSITPVRSIDTSFVASLSLAGLDLNKLRPDENLSITRPRDFWDRHYTQTRLADNNHATYLNWCNARLEHHD